MNFFAAINLNSVSAENNDFEFYELADEVEADQTGACEKDVSETDGWIDGDTELWASESGDAVTAELTEADAEMKNMIKHLF